MTNKYVCEYCIERDSLEAKCTESVCNRSDSFYRCKYCTEADKMIYKCVSYKCSRNIHHYITQKPAGYKPTFTAYMCRSCHEKECPEFDEEDGRGWCFHDIAPIEFWECEHKL